jgi:hypothetical protein
MSVSRSGPASYSPSVAQAAGPVLVLVVLRKKPQATPAARGFFFFLELMCQL